ncbi:hypothetical protein CC1G_14536 [Coprinopsis cinerea okayama7|uniref:Uncharacterized protein n=1 Tax=Coprinopsis cinerea (strain Okayama-7 / 130 / ATCC MYA-4618 / FGSC 9003) TaxID=240176 RepID=D6RMY4_COPC7|nr:hypothetical protein CC1G_14536 [Coprinopsis cinerea okayama7\|eukprot:XP_002911104.1 hypothetical protein CC1G_14536 [Coprinopsis cinerea okayama7\
MAFLRLSRRGRSRGLGEGDPPIYREPMISGLIQVLKSPRMMKKLCRSLELRRVFEVPSTLGPIFLLPRTMNSKERRWMIRVSTTYHRSSKENGLSAQDRGFDRPPRITRVPHLQQGEALAPNDTVDVFNE